MLSLAWIILILYQNIFISHAQNNNIGKNDECNHFYDKPIDVCFSLNSSRIGLVSYKYTCSLNETGEGNFIYLNKYNQTDDCASKQLSNETIVYNLTRDDMIASGPKYNPFISCRGSKPCPYFKGRYYITKILTSSPTADPTQYPTSYPSVSPSYHPTISNGTLNPSIDPSLSPTIEPTTLEPSISPSIYDANYTFLPSLDPTTNPIEWGPYLPNETCARSEYNQYYQDIVYIIDTCVPYRYNKTNISTANDGAESMYNGNITQTINQHNGTAFIARKCNRNSYGIPFSISSSLFLNETCNNSQISDSSEMLYHDGQCYNFTNYEEEFDDIIEFDDIRYIEFDSENEWYKFDLLECNYLSDKDTYGDEYLFYEFDLAASWTIMVLSSLMLLTYTVYAFTSCRTVKVKPQYHETGILVLDDNFSESRLAVLVFQWFALFTLWLNSVFNFLNAWSIIELEDEIQCNLIMSALDLTWHWGKGFLYISLMARIVLIMEGLNEQYEIPGKILKLFAFEIVAYFLLTPVLDLVTTRADHRLYFFQDERRAEAVYVCGEVIEYWISFLLLFGDLMLCSTTIGVYLYAVGEMVLSPIKNQKIMDICIRYTIFSIFASIFIMIGNALWSSNSFSVCRYIDAIFSVMSIMYLLTVCTSCYNQCCQRCHKRFRTRYIDSFLIHKERMIYKELLEIKNNPKYIIKSYDRNFDEKLTQILSPQNLAANGTMDIYHENRALHHAHSNIKSKRKLKKIRKQLEKRRKSKGKKQGIAVELNDRELRAMQRLLMVSKANATMAQLKSLPSAYTNDTNTSSNLSHSTASSKKATATNTNNKLTPINTATKQGDGNTIDDDIAANLDLGLMDDTSSNKSKSINDSGFEYNDTEYTKTITTIKKGVRKKKNVGLLAHLNPTDSTLPQSLTIAIHASVIETVKNDKENREMSLDHKMYKRMDEIHTKVETYWDENTIIFPRRSPTIYPGMAYKLTRAERFDLNKRKKEISKMRHSDSEDRSDSADSEEEDDDAADEEQKWPKMSRKYGHSKNLTVIYETLEGLEEATLLKIWNYIAKENKKRIDYKADLVKLLGAFFLLYFRKKQYAAIRHSAKLSRGNLNNLVNGKKETAHKHQKTMSLAIETPPDFKELEPLLKLLAKYIRDTLRKKKKRYLKKTDYVKNFIKKYLKDAIEKRRKFLEQRSAKLSVGSPSSMISFTSEVSSKFKSDMNHIGTLDYIIEEEEEDAKQSELPVLEDVNTSELLFGLNTKRESKPPEIDENAKEAAKTVSNPEPTATITPFPSNPTSPLAAALKLPSRSFSHEEEQKNKMNKKRSSRKQQKIKPRVRDDAAAHIELQQMLDAYEYREDRKNTLFTTDHNADNKEEEEEYEPKLKIDEDIKVLQKRREEHQKQIKHIVNSSKHKMPNMLLNQTTLSTPLAPIQDMASMSMKTPEPDDYYSHNLQNLQNMTATNNTSNTHTITTNTNDYDFTPRNDMDVDDLTISPVGTPQFIAQLNHKKNDEVDEIPDVNLNHGLLTDDDEDDDSILDDDINHDGHTKDATDATEIFNADAMVPVPHKVVVIDEKQIGSSNSSNKHSNGKTQQSLQIDDDLIGAVTDMIDLNTPKTADSVDDENNAEKVMEDTVNGMEDKEKHEPTDTVVELNGHNENNKKNATLNAEKPSMKDAVSDEWVSQNFLDDVLGDIAVNNSDDDDDEAP